ncbi:MULTISPECIES: N-acetyltransferase [Tatumella]|uniref:GNAT family N-acetyltransferase n=1 Tax=Tatumella punctata TaxID=399969 RepID=A0ABW1VNQ1_9GAMM|nr:MULTISPECIES: N-acetyltransferase [unclassified Tatumella]MBS0856387.1 N-acetyltransferase [Tatumella sp. JGM16]MBS0877395.1 N-acetyltransferase [Tatumella sp. JGM82]MBS0890732.1 N-acetyltransferase [Tatumella sp. JGM94]MBS0893482.1 N-acetyltransferase [Tatumella sp. JGM130]MBS0901792.1 N-acetyltransferase [Tatumella sp. JGM100]
MLIRTEIGIDAPGIDRLLKHCFGSEHEAKRVRMLREQGLLTLGVVATDDEGQVLGYAAFSPVTSGGEDHGWVVLYPLAVNSDQPAGLDEKLVCEALDTLNEFGYSAVIAENQTACLPRVGFTVADGLEYQCPAGHTQQALLIYPLANGPTETGHGTLTFSAPFYG